MSLTFTHTHRANKMTKLKLVEDDVQLTSGQLAAYTGILEAFAERPKKVKKEDGTRETVGANTVVLKGAAGTGKTFLLKRVITKLYQEPVLCALTHKAAAVMSKQTGRDVITLAKLLKQSKYDDLDTGVSKFKSAKDISLPDGKSIVFIDESSMMSKENFETVQNVIMPRYHVLLIGDKYQLPPVNEEESMAFAQDFESYELTEPCRFGAGSGIDKTAITVRTALENSGKMEGMRDILDDHDDVIWVGVNEAVAMMKDVFANAKDADSARVLSFTNAQVHRYNAYMKRALKSDGQRYSVGDMVMANNSYSPNESVTGIFTSVNNNESLLLARVDETTILLEDGVRSVDCWLLTSECGREVLVAKDQQEVELRVSHLRSKALSFGKGTEDRRSYFRRMFSYENNLGDIRLNFAQTVHKSQGSTYDVCFFDLNRLDKDTQLGKQLLYTGVTRAAKKLVLFR